MRTSREAPQLKNILVAPATAALGVGDVQLFTLTGAYSDGSIADLSGSALWSSSDPAVAAVDTTGLVTALDDGTTQIAASTGGLTSSAIVAVNVTLMSLSVTPTLAQLQINASQQFTASATYSDASIVDVTALVDWSANPAIGRIDASGAATGIAAGTCAVLARLEALMAAAKLTVLAAAVAPSFDPCAMCNKVYAQYLQLMSGQAVVVVETPGLGRVEYSKGDAGNLQRLLDTLAQQCAAAGGFPPAGLGARRRPISIEAWP